MWTATCRDLACRRPQSDVQRHSKLVERPAFQQVGRLAAYTGAGTYFVHVTIKAGLDAIAETRRRRAPVYSEVLTLALSCTGARYQEADGCSCASMAKVWPTASLMAVEVS
jgi:dihydroorotase-like cyclic amidohydrolase